MPALLIAVDGVVGGVEVEHDAQRRLAVGLEEEVDEQPLNDFRIMVELVMAIPADLARVANLQSHAHQVSLEQANPVLRIVVSPR